MTSKVSKTATSRKPAKSSKSKKSKPKTRSGGLKLRHGQPKDAETCSLICYEAFKAINDAHGFPPDFPSPEAPLGFLSMMLAHPEGFYGVVAEIGGRVVGSNFLSYGDPIHGVGPITVDPKIQNSGIGKTLMLDVMKFSRRKGAAGIRLVQAAFHNRSLSLYTKLGFDTTEPLSCICGPALNRALPGFTVRPVKKSDVEACNALHLRLHGFVRGRELLGAVAQKTAMLAERDGAIAAFTTGIGFMGYAVAEDNEALKALIAAAPLSPPGFLLPTRNSDLMRWCLANGLRVMQPMNLMSHGFYNEPKGAFLPSVIY